MSQEHLDARRVQILEGARSAFSRWGYDGATVARLEAEIGLSRGAIFHYFPSKKDLFVELAAEVSRHYVALLTGGGLDAAIREMAAESPDWLGVLVETHARMRHDPEFHRRAATPPEERDLLVDWFEARQEDGTLRSDVSALELGRFATIVLNGLALRVLGDDETDVEALLRLLHDALGPRESHYHRPR